MEVMQPSNECLSSALCAQCGVPLDAKPFDASGVLPAPLVGSSVVLARFELPPQYCGTLEFFSQFTDVYASDNAKVRTPGFLWSILSNSRPLFPYLQLDRILNPWGFGSFQTTVRLDESSTIEFVVRGVPIQPEDREDATPAVSRLGGRLVGRYWYNRAYGDVVRRGR